MLSGVRIGVLRAGERVTLTDNKNRRHSVLLAEGGRFHTTKGAVEHDDENVSLVVYMLGWSIALAPFENRRVQLLALGAPDGAVSTYGFGGREKLKVAH